MPVVYKGQGGAKEELFASTDSAPCVDALEAEWLAATLLVFENFTPLVPVDALGKEQQG